MSAAAARIVLLLGLVVTGVGADAWGPWAGLGAGMPLCLLAAWMEGRKRRDGGGECLRRESREARGQQPSGVDSAPDGFGASGGGQEARAAAAFLPRGTATSFVHLLIVSRT